MSSDEQVPSDEFSPEENSSEENSREENSSEENTFEENLSEGSVVLSGADAILEALGKHKYSSHNEKYVEENPYFYVEDCFLTDDIQVSVDKVGNLEFPLTEETVKKVLKQSFKAKFGKGEKMILDTTVRDTQMIPGEKLKVEIKEEALSAVLSRMTKDLNIDPNSRLIPHLYNMLIYERGQFFKEHKDSEKVQNMIATMVILLPSPHEGGELIIKHEGKICRFTGSSNHKIVKCVAFYSDCTHEVLKVKQGFRVALTYNIELRCGNDQNLKPVKPKLRKALSDYFAEKNPETNPKLVYYLNHLYSERSVNWSMLKGSDRNDALALLAAAKELGYLPTLALVEYHKEMELRDYVDDEELESDTELKMLVDENNIKYKLQEGSISVGDNEACCSIETEDLIEPKKSEVEGWTGNAAQTQDYWYTRAAVVIFKSKWSIPIGFRAQLKSLHDLTRKPGNQAILKIKFDENSNDFLHAKLLDKVCEGADKESDVVDMIMDIALYLNDKKSALKIISRFSAGRTLKLVKIPKLLECFDKMLEPASWMKILSVWKKKESDYNNGRKKVKSVLQTYFLSYFKKHPDDYDVQVVEYLLSEIIDSLGASGTYYWGNNISVTDMNFQNDLKYISQILDDLKNERLEKNLSVKLREKLSAQKVVVTNEHLVILQKLLTPNQYSRVSDIFLEQTINAGLNNLEAYREKTYTYLIDPDEANIKKFCSLVLTFMKVQDPQLRVKVLTRMESKRDIYTGILIVGSIKNLKNINWNQNPINLDLLSLCLKIVNRQLASAEGKICWSLTFSNSCHCSFCSPVKTFLSSATSKKETFLLTQHKKDHVTSKFKPSPTCPITFKEVQNKQKFNLTIEKTNKVVSDHQNFVDYLRAGKDKVMQLMQNFSVSDGCNPPPCKIKKS